ncbi:unnamed protein product (macronuclear) [Paramecium tetraurelia]|uniref:Protein kinase domain-containing protein n=1 Tax=Paramecium tetraurelia TaxID=5888 RepID=A0CWH2_PARTE|nr:uncharacterized protein GSPATT00001342001 [Paramecium tetraurelia]CAK75139.1 unnamed protein product [Paramecium tetraurelia]|eukprot:XP_001442536.1 hypothetical protein (macronuclear) [Paramecium tetraurelia strain d4-2]
MKIKLKYYDDWGEEQICIIKVPSKGTVDDLQAEIQKVTQIEVCNQKLYLFTKSQMMEIEKHSYLSSIQFSPESIVFVKNVDDQFSINSSFNSQKQQQQFKSCNSNSLAADLQNTLNDSFRNSFKNNQFKSSTNINQHNDIEKFYEFIQTNNFQKAKHLLDNYDKNKTLLLNDLSVFGWSSLHVAIVTGYEKIVLWLLSEGADVNLETNDGWNCLSLAVCLKLKQIVLFLIGQPDININKASKHGTALHLAAQIDDADITMSLLQHPNIDVNIQDKTNRRPIEIAGTQVRQLLKYENELKLNTVYRNSFMKSMNGINLEDLQKDTFIINKPTRPPILTGKVLKVNYFKLIMYQRFLIADPDSGTLVRFKTEKDIPNNPNEVIALDQINEIRVAKDEWFQEDQYHYLEIKYSGNHLFIAFKETNAARRWYEGLKNCVGYARYINQNFLIRGSTDEIKNARRAYNLMLQKPNQIMNILDSPAIEQKRYIQQQQKAKKEKFKQSLASVSEAEYEIDLVDEKGSQKKLSNIGLSSLSSFELIGKGSFGKVYKAKYKNLYCALKQQEKSMLIKHDFLNYTLLELQILKTIKHPFIVRLYFAFQTQNYLYLATELCPAGDLARYMTRGKILDEYTAKFIVAQIVLAVEYLHSKSILYRDLKPENILIDSEGYIKLTDFGLCKQGHVGQEIIAKSFCGSPAYLPPELIEGIGSSKATDIYQIGTILFEMLTGYPPYFNTNIKTLIENIKYQPLQIPKGISATAADLLRLLLVKSPKERLAQVDLHKIKKHLFFAEIDWTRLQAKQYKPPGLTLRNNCNNSRNGFKFLENKNDLDDIDYKDGQEKLNFIQNWNISFI